MKLLRYLRRKLRRNRRVGALARLFAFLGDVLTWQRVLIIVLANLTVYFFLQSDFLRLERIIVQPRSQRFVKRQAVEKELARYFNRPIVSLQTDELEDKILQKFLPIRETNAAKELPDTLRVQYSEREPRLQVKTAEAIYLVDQEGLVFSQTQRLDLKVPEVAVSKENRSKIRLGELLPSKRVEWLVKLANFNWARVSARLVSVSAKDSFYELTLEGQVESKVILNTKKEFNKQMEKLVLIFNEAQKSGRKVVRLDLRFKNPVVRYQ